MLRNVFEIKLGNYNISRKGGKTYLRYDGLSKGWNWRVSRLGAYLYSSQVLLQRYHSIVPTISITAS